MANLKIEMELLSEAIFGSGYSVPGFVDLEVVLDKYGFPYMKAKTFKGNLRKHIQQEIKILNENFNKDYNEELSRLLGSRNSGVTSWENIKFSDCCIGDNIRNFLMYAVDNGKIKKTEITNALTSRRSFTAIEDDGSYKEHSLRNIRVIKKDLKFYSYVNCERELEEKEIQLLALGVSTMRHVGSMRTRGKGEVKLRLFLLENGKYEDKTEYYINKLMEEVKKSE